MSGNSGIILRPITSDDLPFLRRLYGSTREDELEVVAWSNSQKESFLDMQFQAQHIYYMQNYADASFEVIELDRLPIGRLYVDRRANEIRIVDIALLPEYRGQGIGSMLLRQLFDEGTHTGLPITIHVEHFNPALNLYKRLGFRKIDDHGIYFLMLWRPAEQETAVSPHDQFQQEKKQI